MEFSLSSQARKARNCPDWYAKLSDWAGKLASSENELGPGSDAIRGSLLLLLDGEAIISLRCTPLFRKIDRDMKGAVLGSEKKFLATRATGRTAAAVTGERTPVLGFREQ